MSYIIVIPKDSPSSTVIKSSIFSIAMSSLTSIFIVSPSSDSVISVHPASRREATISRTIDLFMLITEMWRFINVSPTWIFSKTQIHELDSNG